MHRPPGPTRSGLLSGPVSREPRSRQPRRWQALWRRGALLGFHEWPEQSHAPLGAPPTSLLQWSKQIWSLQSTTPRLCGVCRGMLVQSDWPIAINDSLTAGAASDNVHNLSSSFFTTLRYHF